MFVEAIEEFRRQHDSRDPEVIWVTRRAAVVLLAQAGWPAIAIPVRFCNDPPPLVTTGTGRALVLLLRNLPGDRQGVVAAETGSVE